MESREPPDTAYSRIESRPRRWYENRNAIVNLAIILFCLLLVALLIVGVANRAVRLVMLVVACIAIAIVVVRLPASWRAKFGLLATAVVGAAGVIPPLVNEPPGPPPPPVTSAKVNTAYLAELIKKGPFSADLPPPVEFAGSRQAFLGDTSNEVGAVAINLTWEDQYDPFPDFDGPSAQIEIYRTPEDARRRAEQRYNALREQYKDFGDIHGAINDFFLFGNNEVIACGYTGYIFVEAYSFPDGNADIPLARGTVSAILRYGEAMTKIATQ